MEPLESGQSGKAMPAPMVVVNPPAYSRQSVPAKTNRQKAKRRLLGWEVEIVRVHNEEWLWNDLSVNYR